MTTMRKLTLLIAWIALSTSMDTQSQIIQDGAWVGQIIHRNGRSMDVTYNVQNEHNGLKIVMEVEEYGPFRFKDIRVTADSLFFVWEPSFELPCTLVRLQDGIYHGMCADPWGGYGGAIMAPPGSDRDALILDQSTFSGMTDLDETGPEPEEWRLGNAYPVGKAIKVNGLEVNYVDAGTGSEVVVLIAGLGDNLTTWETLQQRLAQNIRTIAYDRPGLGLSGASRIPRTLDQMASELSALLQSIDAPAPYLLVAHAEGSLIARRFADLYGERVRGLVLVDPHHENQARIWTAFDAKAWQSYWGRLKRFQSMLPGGVGQEFRAYAQIIEQEAGQELASVPSHPTAVLTAGRVSDTPVWAGESQRGREVWTEFHASWVEKMEDGIHLILESGPNIHQEQPGKVEQIIRDMLSGN